MMIETIWIIDKRFTNKHQINDKQWWHAHAGTGIFLKLKGKWSKKKVPALYNSVWFIFIFYFVPDESSNNLRVTFKIIIPKDHNYH